jgi:hypothetical protein
VREGIISGGKLEMRATSEDDRMFESSSFSAKALSAFEENAEDKHMQAETTICTGSVRVETDAPIAAEPALATGINPMIELLERGMLA